MFWRKGAPGAAQQLSEVCKEACPPSFCGCKGGWETEGREDRRFLRGGACKHVLQSPVQWTAQGLLAVCLCPSYPTPLPAQTETTTDNTQRNSLLYSNKTSFTETPNWRGAAGHGSALGSCRLLTCLREIMIRVRNGSTERGHLEQSHGCRPKAGRSSAHTERRLSLGPEGATDAAFHRCLLVCVF